MNLGHSSHPLGACNVTQGLRNKSNISIRFLDVGLLTGNDLRQGSHWSGNVKGVDLDIGQNYWVSLSSSRRSSSKTLTCELLSAPSNRMTFAEPLCG